MGPFGGARRFGLLLLLALGACATVPDTADEAALRERPTQPKMHAELVRGMLAQGKFHAALAHIEELERVGDGDRDELTWLRALTLFKLDQIAESRQRYQELLNTEYAGQAHHGLGLIAARSDLRRAVRHFNAAIKLRPTDAEIRNDLGYTLLLARRLTEARHHLATAAELAPDNERAKSNLVLSWLVEDRQPQAMGLAQSLGVGPEQMRQLQAESRLIRELINERAAEFNAGDRLEDDADEEFPAPTVDRPLPGLYRRTR